MKPTPMGRMPGVVDWIGESVSRLWACRSWLERSLSSLPAPTKPRPPAWDTATARGAREIRRMGAQAMKGELVHG